MIEDLKIVANRGVPYQPPHLKVFLAEQLAKEPVGLR
jgi:hypothetical protein